MRHTADIITASISQIVAFINPDRLIYDTF